MINMINLKLFWSNHRVGVTTLAIGLIGWQLVSQNHWILPLFLPSPSQIGVALIQLITKADFSGDIVVTAGRVVMGMGLAAVTAIPIGFLCSCYRPVAAALEPMVDFVRYTPIPAFIPLFILWFGIGESEKMLIIWASVFFQLVIMVTHAISSTDPHLVESAQTLGANSVQILTKVIWPSAQPRILNDLRISLGLAWSAVMMAEIAGATHGIGYVIIQAQRLLRTDQVLAGIVVIGLLGLLSDQLAKRLYSKLYPWLEELPHA
jgi:NitT/TauT family transport system permease protein